MSLIILISNIIIFLFKYISCRSKEEWKSRSIYQLLTDRFARTSNTGTCNYSRYCGGNYQGIIQKLDYIQGMGFNAIWISPIVENIENEYNYHGYGFKNFYNLNWHFGSEDDFKNLVSECHKRDIWVMVDVVANHVGSVGTDFSQITPFNREEHYHTWCEIDDWENIWKIENCRLSSFPDLKQENNWVTEELDYWIYYLINKYDLDGIRIDTVLEVSKWFWDKFSSSAGVFQIGEAFHGDINRVKDYQNHLDSIFNFPLFYVIESSFCENFKNLETYLNNASPQYPFPEYIATFVENHDTPRFLSRTNCNDRNKFTNAIVFSLLWVGIPVVYYGGEQYYSGGNDPNNRENLWENYNTNSELYIIIGKVNRLRQKVNIWNYEVIQRYCNKYFYAFTRGNVLACFSNNNGGDYSLDYHEFNNGDQLCNILSDDDCVIVSDGKINIKMEKLPKVYVKF